MFNLPNEIQNHILSFISHKCCVCSINKINLRIGICNTCKKNYCLEHSGEENFQEEINKIYCENCELELWKSITNVFRDIFPF